MPCVASRKEILHADWLKGRGAPYHAATAACLGEGDYYTTMTRAFDLMKAQVLKLLSAPPISFYTNYIKVINESKSKIGPFSMPRVLLICSKKSTLSLKVSLAMFSIDSFIPYISFDGI